MGRQGHDDGRRVGEGDALDDRRPADDRRAQEAEEAEDAPEDAPDAPPIAEFRQGLGRREAIAVLLLLGIPGDDRDRAEGGVVPADELQAPVGGIHADDARAQAVEPDDTSFVTVVPLLEYTPMSKLPDEVPSANPILVAVKEWVARTRQKVARFATVRLPKSPTRATAGSNVTR